MRHTRVLLLAGVLLSILAVCGPADGEYAFPHFRKTENRDFTVLGDELMISILGDAAVWGDHIILLSRDLATGNNVHFYDKRTGAWEMDALPTGRGPGELLLATDIHVLADTLFVIDANPTRIIKYSLPALLARAPMSETLLGILPMERWASWAKSAPGRTVQVSTRSFLHPEEAPPRITWTGPEGTVATYDEYPFEDGEMIWTLYNAAYPYWDLSPDGSKLVISGTWGTIMEMFDLAEGSISRRGIHYWVDPSRVGNTRNLATDRWIITAFFNETPDAFTGRRAADRLAVFDWDGKGIRCVQLSGYTAEPIWYDEAEKVLYAVLRDRNDVQYLGKLPLD